MSIEGYSVTLDEGWNLSTLIEICERLYRVSYAHWQYYTTHGKLYCGSEYMGRVIDVRASRVEGAHCYFEAVPGKVTI